jgi:hypothetical protein
VGQMTVHVRGLESCCCVLAEGVAAVETLGICLITGVGSAVDSSTAC